MKQILLIFGSLTFLIGVVKAIIYINKFKNYKHFKSTKGCVVGFFSPDKDKNYDTSKFGFDVINYDNDDEALLFKEGMNTNAGVIEYMVDNDKYKLVDHFNDTNLMNIGEEVLVRFDPKKPKKAFVVDNFDGDILFVVGAFLIVLGAII